MINFDFIRAANVEIVDVLPKIETLPDGVVVGQYSYRYPDGKVLIPYQYKREWEDMTYTETGFTRRFLHSLPKVRVRKPEYLTYVSARAPLFVRPGRMLDAVYIDIQAAYPSVYGLTGWTVDYVRDLYVRTGDPLLYPFPGAWKIGRSYVVTGARAKQTRSFIRGGQIVSKPAINSLSNPPFVALVYDTLSMIALYAVNVFRCRYYNTDGGIFPQYIAEHYKNFLASLGLVGREKWSGHAMVWSSGVWRVGSHTTKLRVSNLVRGVMGGNWIAMNERQAEWLYPRVSCLKG